MICYLSRNYKGVNNAANKAKTDIEYIMEQCGYRNVGLKQTRYTNAVIAFILTLSGVLKSVFCLHRVDTAISVKEILYICLLYGASARL